MGSLIGTKLNFRRFMCTLVSIVFLKRLELSSIPVRDFFRNTFSIYSPDSKYRLYDTIHVAIIYIAIIIPRSKIFFFLFY
jgi:hypothetical protein